MRALGAGRVLAIVVSVLVLGVAAGSPARPAAQTGPVLPQAYLFAIGAQDAPGRFRALHRIAVGPAGRVYLADGSNHRVQVLDGLAGFERMWGGPGSAEGRFCDPHGLDVAPDGTVFVADFCNDRIQAFDAAGRFSHGWSGYPDPVRPERQRPFKPSDVAVAADGSVLVADWRFNLVLRFDRSGHFLNAWGGAGTEPGHFVGIAGMDVAADGRVYVAESGGEGRVQVFDLAGTLVNQWLHAPASDIEVSADRVYVTGDSGATVAWFDHAGAPVGGMPQAEPGEGDPAGLHAPVSIAIGADGSLYVAESVSEGRTPRLARFTRDGVFAGEWRGSPTADGVLSPAAVALDLQGRLHVADEAFGQVRVQVLDSDGRHHATWRDGGPAGAGPDIGGWMPPGGMAVGVDGTTYVADRERGVIERLDADGDSLGVLGGGAGAAPGQFSEWGPHDLELTHEASSHPRLLYAVDAGNTRVQAFDVQGAVRHVWGGAGEGEGRFAQGAVGHITTAPSGAVYVSETSSRQRIQVFDWEGAFLFSFRGHLGQDSRVALLQGIDFAPDGTLYASDSRQRIQAFTSAGEYLGYWDTINSRPDLRIPPGDLVAGADGRLYVADRSFGRVHVFGIEHLPDWRVEVFPNPWLTGAPARVDHVVAPTFDWAGGSPGPGVPPDGFSVRLSRFVALEAGEHRFLLEGDGGVRFWVDESLLIDDWEAGHASHEVVLELDAGRHLLQLEYFDESGDAALALEIDGNVFVPTATPASASSPRSIVHLPALGR